MNKRKRIGVCVTSMHEIFVQRNLDEICKAAERRGCDLHIFGAFTDLYNNSASDKAQKRIFSMVKDYPLDALVIFADMIKDELVKEDLVTYANAKGIPVISIRETRKGCCSIHYDSIAALREMISHVIDEHNCSNIYMMSGLKGNPIATKREECFKEVLGEHGMEVEQNHIVYGDFWSMPAKRAMEKLLEQDPLPDAVICANDAMAIAACDVLEKRGIRVPEDMIVTGLGGIREREYHFPLITTGIYDPVATSEFVFQCLDNMENGEFTSDREVTIPCRVDYTESCGCKGHNRDLLAKRLVDTYAKLETERAYSHEVVHLISDIGSSGSVISLATELPKYVGKIGIDAYKLYICTKYMDALTGEEGDESFTLLSSMQDEESQIECQLLSGADICESLEDYQQRYGCLFSVPLDVEDKFVGFLTFHYDSNKIAHEILYQLLVNVMEGLELVIASMELERVNRALYEVSEKTIQSLAEIVEGKSEVTGSHIKRVSEYTRVLADALGYAKEEVDIIRIASMMHDIGKINIPSDILEKPGKLTDEEFEVIKTHVVHGENMLKNSPGEIMKKACVIAKEHHEKWNGKGYLGMAGEEIHQESRIVALADVFDALVSERPYKKAFSPEKAYDIIVGDSGTHFDPAVVAAFQENFGKFKAIMYSYKE